MEFQLNEDQQALQEGIRAFCDDQFAFDRFPELEKAPFTRDAWASLAEMGVFGLRVPEEQGGVGLGMAEAVLVFAELGRRLVPGPALWSALAAPYLEGAAGGDLVVGGVDERRASSDPVIVEYAEHLDALVALRADGLYRIDPKALSFTPSATPLDPLTPIAHLKELPAGDRIADAAAAARIALEGTALTSALMLGVAESTLEYAVEYAKGREQFDRPIASFQAIKHFCADMHTKLEMARAAVYAAGCTLDDPEIGNVERAVSSARVVAGDASMKNARLCIQIYGGMGYTWELPPHYYLKRAFVLENAFGTGEQHSELVADRITDI